MSRKDGAAWCAVADLDGWGQDWERTAWLCSEFHNSLMLMIAKLKSTLGVEIDEDDFRWMHDYRPRHKWERKPPRPVDYDPNQVGDALNKMAERLK